MPRRTAQRRLDHSERGTRGWARATTQHISWEAGGFSQEDLRIIVPCFGKSHPIEVWGDCLDRRKHFAGRIYRMLH